MAKCTRPFVIKNELKKLSTNIIVVGLNDADLLDTCFSTRSINSAWQKYDFTRIIPNGLPTLNLGLNSMETMWRKLAQKVCKIEQAWYGMSQNVCKSQEF